MEVRELLIVVPLFPVKLAIYSKEQLVTDITPVKVPVGAQSRDRLLARLEPTRHGADPRLTGEQEVWGGRQGRT